MCFVRSRDKTFKTWTMQSFMLHIFGSLWSTIASRFSLTVPAVILKLSKLVSEYIWQFQSFTLAAGLFIQWKMEIIKKKISDSAVPLNFMEHFSILQPLVFIVLGHVPFTTLVTSLFSNQKAVKQEWAETKTELQEEIHRIYIVR